jgi:hypothetical protein
VIYAGTLGNLGESQDAFLLTQSFHRPLDPAKREVGPGFNRFTQRNNRERKSGQAFATVQLAVLSYITCDFTLHNSDRLFRRAFESGSGLGENHLGRILMKLRDEYRRQVVSTAASR